MGERDGRDLLIDPYSITPEMVQHIAKLAALEFQPSEEEHFLQELNRILEHMKQLKLLNVDQLEASIQTFPAVNVMREDQASPGLSQDQVLQNAPEKENGFFKIPPILETEA